MRTLGLIGGTSWLSTVDYYRIINQEVNRRLGGLHSAKLFLYSLNYEEFRPTDDPEKWKEITELLTVLSKKLHQAGAECIVLCANTPHLVADEVQEQIEIPLIHIAEATASEVKRQGMRRVGLLGTKFTMEKDFFRKKLEKNGVDTIIPSPENRAFIHNSIFNELGKGLFTADLKTKYLDIISQLKEQGAEGVIFGCTEIPLLIKQEESPLPVFDTAIIHATAAVEFALH